MGSGLSNNQINNFRMLSLFQEKSLENDKVKPDQSECNNKLEDTTMVSPKNKLKYQTNLIELIRNKPKKVNATPMRDSGVISKSPSINKPFIDYAQTNLIHFIRSSQKMEKAELSMEKYLNIKESQILGSQRLKPRKSLAVQHTLEVVQTSRLEKSINVEGMAQINQYTVIESLGQGAFGKVKKAQNFKGEQFAIKIANKKKLKKKLLSKSNAYTMLEREIAIMKKISHTNVVQLYEVIDDPKQDKLYLVMEYMGKGSILSKGFFKKNKETSNILDEIEDKNINQRLTEEQCRHYFSDFIKGLDYLHECVNVIHRDIKPDNLLVNIQDQLKIADFGVSHIMEDGQDGRISNQTGTQAYLAPEVFKGSNFDGKPVDIWAGGVTLYQMVYGRLPFPSQKSMELRQQILEDNPPFPQPIGFHSSILKLLKGMLEKNAEKRYKIDQIILDDWLTEFGKQPLQNEYIQYVDVTEMDIKFALTSLNIQMALKIVVKLLYLSKKAKKAIALKKQQQKI
ncbi:unnamed protein product (macronuclear) [Paramecium tetraurelia]|uniref:non-specific serine/threonine protein kinase n=1 Tax=Paramecium tetraurelia TaxID=5888 RepID=A0EC88_PARTE|nr:uncharacterized protein GSPATT00025641001 [Paramecium tetraurelia]CAK92905.1 unnamed protein product [Paramecium tetraurelia]|eukprot:XP_001460302.1 hypothetical protein (macronuclear) [Paramecium tetraurelia strain d4-2]